ncbi:MAG: hypothetical protein CMH61_00610 [Nanoarchaeota archaeon]|nr:hypothetical protein [Nanoarchaeota archaeon]|tara:strand:- start:5981 stop:6436 length:456 start_codon:yes stop_codon:yes gene_type:complete
MADVTSQAEQMRAHGLTDDQIQQEMQSSYQPPPMPTAPSGGNYDRMEQIAETIIDEKWDALLTEVKKIIDWKSGVEDQLQKALSELSSMKEDFKELRGAILGKVEEYDRRMIDVSTELKAVGKVFKDVIPEFTNNVKELTAVSSKLKKKKK